MTMTVASAAAVVTGGTTSGAYAGGLANLVEEKGEEAEEGLAEGGHAGDDDGEVGFDNGPHAAIDGLPHAVCPDGGEVESCEA